MNTTKAVYAMLAFMMAGCGIRGGIHTEVVTSKDGRWEYIQTVKDGTVIARYVDTCDDEGVMI